jgi:hypothetical protein
VGKASFFTSARYILTKSFRHCKLLLIKEPWHLPARTFISSYDLHEWDLPALSDKSGWFWNRGSLTNLEGELAHCRACGYIGHNRKTQTYIQAPMCIRKFDASGKAFYSPEIIQPQLTEQNSKFFPTHAVKEYRREYRIFSNIIHTQFFAIS